MKLVQSRGTPLHILVSPQVPLPDGIEFFESPTMLFEYMAAGKGIRRQPARSDRRGALSVAIPGLPPRPSCVLGWAQRQESALAASTHSILRRHLGVVSCSDEVPELSEEIVHALPVRLCSQQSCGATTADFLNQGRFARQPRVDYFND
jgi:hypothetical protein